LIIALTIIGSMIGLCAVCGIGAVIIGKNADTATTNSGGNGEGDSASGNEAASSANAAKAAGLNTTVRDGTFEFVVSKVECGKTQVGGQILNKKAQGQYCLVTLSVKNIGTKPQTFFVDNQKAFSGSTEYSPDGTATMYASGEQSTWINEINPGNKISGPLVYDVPAGTKLTKIELHDSIISGGVSVTIS
jgi:hypothetical protein